MTLIIVILTSVLSILTLYNPELFHKLQFNAYQVWHRKEYYRLISHGFIHADWIHLAVNMIVLYSFGEVVEAWFNKLAELNYMHFPNLWYLALYLLGIIFSSSITLFKEKDNPSYNAVGASGAVSAILFTSIFFSPVAKIYFYGVLPVPGIVFGILYLIYSQYMSRKNMDNVNHDAHFLGAIFGFIFPLFINLKLFTHFIHQLGL
jgi:membrane associated rhomboid family serine protease